MSTRVYIDPTYTRADRGDGGIRRVTEAMHKYLPEFGVTPVMDADHADVINNHGASLTKRRGVPIVHSGHGLYWASLEWPHWAHDTNAQVVESMACAVAHTAPSEWVARALRRGMFVYPEVIYHGVDAEDWTPGGNGGYVLWNKARTDAVSNPVDMQSVAALLPSVRFVSTFGNATGNVKVTGQMPVGEMRNLVSGAGVYLATARETFGIGTLEALACGVPVAGWDWGGQSEIIMQGETGYLAKPGDMHALAECIKLCLEHRKRLGDNARADAVTRWGWRERIAQYAALFKRVHAESMEARPRVSVIVTCHNLGQYLPQALDSVSAQSVKDWECVIVNDASTDDTAEIAERYTAQDARFVYAPTTGNLKLPGALNFGVSRARGRYILPLDADNWLDPLALETLARALDDDNAIHIAYGHLDIVRHDGTERRRNMGWPPQEFSWRAQMAHLNQITSTALYRREVWERSGGYRTRQWRAEDAEFWSRATSFGFRARKVTELSVFTYRDRSDSKSKGEGGDGNWLAWLPWACASTAQEGAAMIRDNKGPDLSRVPWGAQGPIPNGMKFWDVHDFSQPRVSVIIPVGPNHRRYLMDALDSLVSQTFGNWEAVVVYDDGVPTPERIAGAPFARIFATDGRRGPGVARNLGAKHARGEVLYFLDADDYLLPYALEKMIAAYDETEGNIIYGDWLRNDSDSKPLRWYEAEDFECGSALKKMQHSTNMMIAKAKHDEIGGFDESMTGWEDWDYCIAAQSIGLCSTRIAEPLFVYRFRAGGRRESSFGDGAKLRAYLRSKWARYYEGGEELMCGCNKNKKANAGLPAAPTPAFNGAEGSGLVLLEYRGAIAGPLVFRGESGTMYRFGHDQSHRQKLVRPEDAEDFLKRTTRGAPQFVRVGLAPEPAPALRQTAAAEVVDAPVEVERVKAETHAMEPEPEPIREAGVIPPPVSGPPTPPPALGPVEKPAPPRRSVLTMSVKEVKDALKKAKQADILAWTSEEQSQPTPRATVITELRRALNRGNA